MIFSTSQPKDILSSSGVQYNAIQSFTIGMIVDTLDEKAIYANTQFGPLLLWSGQDYDDIGNWTQEEADLRIQELLDAGPVFSTSMDIVDGV